jgi:hypothetical protein
MGVSWSQNRRSTLGDFVVILVSSLRPADGCPPEIWRNQLKALASWEDTGNQVVYFNQPQFPDLKVKFVASSEKPRIATLARYCENQNDWSGIVNADIILGPTWPAVEQAIRSSGAKCAISRRWTFPDPEQSELGDDPFEDAALTDQGLDVFCARPEVWKDVAKFVPRQFTLGRILFDTWLMSFFVHNFRCADFTDARVIFHPSHENRGDQSMLRSSDSYLDIVRWPSIRIGPQRAFPTALKTEGGGELRI